MNLPVRGSRHPPPPEVVALLEQGGPSQASEPALASSSSASTPHLQSHSGLGPGPTPTYASTSEPHPRIPVRHQNTFDADTRNDPQAEEHRVEAEAEAEAEAETQMEVVRLLLTPEAEVGATRATRMPRAFTSWQRLIRCIRRDAPSAWSLFRESAPVTCGSVVGLVLVGRLLSRVTQWEAFERVDTLLVLVPVLLNALGNTAMILSLRLATATHGDRLNVQSERIYLLRANMALLLFQATVVATLAAAGAFALRQLLPPEDVSRPPLPWPQRLLLVLAASAGAGIVSTWVVGQALCATVLLGPRLGLDPDNLAAPVASGLGDLMTLLLVALAGAGLLAWAEASVPWVPALVLILALLAGGTSGVYAYQHTETRPLLSHGWTPLLAAATLASGAGLVLDTQAHEIPGYANLAPVLGGLAGNCAATLLSRESTRMHYGKVPDASQHHSDGPSNADMDTSGGNWNADEAAAEEDTRRDREGSWHGGAAPAHGGGRDGYLALGAGDADAFSYFCPVEGWVVASVLLLIGWSAGGGYLVYLSWSPMSQVSFGAVFGGCLMLAWALSVGGGLALAHVLGLLLWRRGYDPDTHALPLVAALVDVFAQILLSAAFAAARWLGDAPRSRAAGAG